MALFRNPAPRPAPSPKPAASQHPMAKMPEKLPYDNRTLLYSGAGRSPSGHTYVDAAQGAFMELYPGQVQQTGVHFAIVRVAGNKALERVRVDAIPGHGVPRIGELLVVGPISFDEAARPRAGNGWMLGAPKPQRATGVFAVQQAPDWGWIQPDDGSPRVFFHVSALRRGSRVEVGDRVSYQPEETPKGWAAKDVCPARVSR